MIEVTDSAEFKRLMKALASDIVNAHIHYQLFKDLNEYLRDHSLVASQSNTFWHFTLQAHLNTAIYTLCRIYDQNDTSLHLYNWLTTIRENLHLFDEDQFRERLRDNPFVDSSAQHPRKPPQEELDEDIRSCSNEDARVKALTVRRGSDIAHRSAKLVVADRSISEDYPLTYGDVDALLERARKVLNRYTDLFSAEVYSTKVIGDKDFQYVIDCVEAKVKESRARHSS
jgi:hypothetical protein